jgi:hypothetical protein
MNGSAQLKVRSNCNAGSPRLQRDNKDLQRRLAILLETLQQVPAARQALADCPTHQTL